MDEFMNEDDRLALRKFESMLKSNKVYFFDSEEFEEIVYFYMDTGKMKLAEKAINLGLSQHPTSISLKLIKVDLFVFNNKLHLASQLLLKIEKEDPTNEEIFIQRASILSKSDNHVGAIKQLEKALVLSDDITDVNALLGMEYLFIENFNKALSNFKICLNIDLEDYAALYNIIYCYDMLDEHENAIKYINEYIDENPYSEIAWHQLGRQYIVVKKHSEAIRAFNYAILIDELFIGAYLEKAKALEEVKEYKEAILNYVFTLELDDPTASTYLQISGCYEKLENYKLAINYAHRAVDEDPLLDSTWLMLTDLYASSGDFQKALHYIQKALEVDSKNSTFINRFAEINIKLDLYEEAALAFKRSIELNDKRLVIYLALFDLLHFIGDYQDAKEVLENALVLFPNSVEIETRLAGIHFDLHEDKKALLFLEKAIINDISYKEIMEDFFPKKLLRNDVIQLIEKYNT